MQSKLFDSELKVMGVLWREGDCTAKHISDILKQEVGWNMNTTYTLIKRCIGKGAIQRSEPNFLCHALIQKEEVRNSARPLYPHPDGRDHAEPELAGAVGLRVQEAHSVLLVPRPHHHLPAAGRDARAVRRPAGTQKAQRTADRAAAQHRRQL